MESVRRPMGARPEEAPYLAGVWMVHDAHAQGDWRRRAISSSLSAEPAPRALPNKSLIVAAQFSDSSIASTSTPLSSATRHRPAMAAMTATMSVTAASVRQFEGLKATTSFAKPVPSLAMRKVAGKGALGARCDYIGSSTNLIMVACTTAMLFAGRFGLAPSANRMSTAGLKLVDRDSGLQTGDPAGFTATDTLACGAMGHVFGVGIVLGLKAIGSL